MFEKLMLDDLVHWAVDYKVDAFRFDIMGHLMLESMTKARDELNALTKEEHGVDGSKIYLYGEGWDFAEMSNNQRGRNATQVNLAGTGIGTFNDRFRDSALGGDPLGHPRTQGFLTGLALVPNPSFDQGSPRAQMRSLMNSSDLLRATMAGNLKEYEICSGNGEWTQGKRFKYHGRIGAYGEQPSESVVYCGCHDNETLFDHIILKVAPSVDIDQKTRICEMALATVLLSQGVAFIHAGDDLLRSKSLDRDSYNSGDWFNRIDWTKETNNFGVGLPPANKNSQWWSVFKPLLADPALKPSSQLIRRCAAHFQSYLKIRYSSALFRIESPDFIRKQVVFYNAGQKQLPGMIVMELNSSYTKGDEGIFDPNFKRLVIVINARPESTAVKFPTNGLELHPELSQSTDYIYSEVEIGRDEVKVPRRSCVVLVEIR